MTDKPENTKRPTPEGVVTRSLTTATAIAVAPTAAVVANHLLNRPKADPPREVVLPRGVDKK